MTLIEQREFLKILKYSQYHIELLKRINTFEEHVVKNHNGSASTKYDAGIHRFIVTTYLPAWEPGNDLTHNFPLYMEVRNLFYPFMEKPLLGYKIVWGTDDHSITFNTGKATYYVYTIPKAGMGSLLTVI